MGKVQRNRNHPISGWGQSPWVLVSNWFVKALAISPVVTFPTRYRQILLYYPCSLLQMEGREKSDEQGGRR